MKNETAAQQLFSVIEGINEYSPNNPLIEALLKSKARLMEIEKQQIIEAFTNGAIDASWGNKYKNAEQYYKEIYGN